jgi:hypothetical protein
MVRISSGLRGLVRFMRVRVPQGIPSMIMQLQGQKGFYHAPSTSVFDKDVFGHIQRVPDFGASCSGEARVIMLLLPYSPKTQHSKVLTLFVS